MLVSILCLAFSFPVSGESLRGFLSKDAEGNWILSDLPNVPSCCAHKTNHYILEGNFEETLYPITVEGELEGNILHHARIIN